MTASRIVAVVALLVGLATLARATRCSAGGEVLVGVALTGVLTAAWNDDTKGGVAGRIATFIVVALLAGLAVGLLAVALHVRCLETVSPAWPTGGLVLAEPSAYPFM
jgi:hypothetical protein